VITVPFVLVPQSSTDAPSSVYLNTPPARAFERIFFDILGSKLHQPSAGADLGLKPPCTCRDYSGDNRRPWGKDIPSADRTPVCISDNSFGTISNCRF